LDRMITNRSRCDTIDGLKSLVSTYIQPRNVDRIVSGLSKDEALPYPIILRGSRGMWIMSGNTRMDVARIMDIEVRALMVEVAE
jgi:hypothetical protein